MEGDFSHTENTTRTCVRGGSTAEERDFKQARAGRSQVGSGLRRTRGDAPAGDGQSETRKWGTAGARTRSDGARWSRIGHDEANVTTNSFGLSTINQW